MQSATTVKLCIMGSEGDRVLTADPADPEQLALVEAEFTQLLSAGYAAFVIEHAGGDARRTGTIVPGAAEHVLFKQGFGG